METSAIFSSQKERGPIWAQMLLEDLELRLLE